MTADRCHPKEIRPHPFMRANNPGSPTRADLARVGVERGICFSLALAGAHLLVLCQGWVALCFVMCSPGRAGLQVGTGLCDPFVAQVVPPMVCSAGDLRVLSVMRVPHPSLSRVRFFPALVTQIVPPIVPAAQVISPPPSTFP